MVPPSIQYVGSYELQPNDVRPRLAPTWLQLITMPDGNVHDPVALFVRNAL
jgi:hypothetical protein